MRMRKENERGGRGRRPRAEAEGEAEAAAAADSMRQQSGELAQRVSVFKVGGKSKPSRESTVAPTFLNGNHHLPKEREVPKQPVQALNPASPEGEDWEAF